MRTHIRRRAALEITQHSFEDVQCSMESDPSHLCSTGIFYNVKRIIHNLWVSGDAIGTQLGNPLLSKFKNNVPWIVSYAPFPWDRST